MSRSCQSGMPSMTGTTCARTTRAMPAMRSLAIGFFLWGIAEEPFWPLPNGSHSSRTSVRWPCRTSSANASQTVAMTASATDPLADAVADDDLRRRRRRGEAELRRDRLLHGRIDVAVRPDRATDLGDGDGVAGPQQPVAAARHREREVGHPVPEGRRLGVDAVRAADLDGVLVLQPEVAHRGHERVALGEQDVGRLDQLQGQRGVEQVAARHAEVHPRRRLARLGVVRPGRQEGDDVVLGDRLDLGDRLGRGRGGAPHRLDAVGGYDARVRVRLEHQHLDRAPQLVLVGLAPDPPHLGQGVALDHGCSRRSAGRPAQSPRRRT